MALLLIEGFEGFGPTGMGSAYVLQGLNCKYTATQPSEGFMSLETGWGGGEAWQTSASNGRLNLNITASSTVYFGFSYRPTIPAFNQYNVASLIDGSGNPIISIAQLYRSRRLIVSVDGISGDPPGHTPPVLTYGRWVFLEFFCHIHDSNGAWELRANEETIAAGSGHATRAASRGSTAEIVQFGLVPPITGFERTRYDDIYVSNSGFLGPLKVRGILPNGDGDSTQWTPDSGDNYTNVDENPQDLSTNADGVQSGTSGQLDLYQYEDMDLETIHGVQVNTTAKLTDATNFTLGNSLKSANTVAHVGNFGLTGTDYRTLWSVRDTNPVTSAPWEASEIGEAQFGFRVV